MRGPRPRDIANDGGMYDHVLEPRAGGVGPDAGEAVVKPVVGRGETRVNLRPVAVPLFPQGGGTLLDHVAPAGVILLLIHAEDEIVAADVLQELD